MCRPTLANRMAAKQPVYHGAKILRTIAEPKVIIEVEFKITY